jgi:hypothetical protein
MPLNVKDLIDKSSDKLMGEKPVIASPIYMGIIVTLVILVIVWIVLKGEVDVIYEDTSLGLLLVKAGVWGFLITTGVAFLHDRAVNKIYSKKHESIVTQQIVDSAISGPITTTGTITPVLNPTAPTPPPVVAPTA